VGQTESPLQRSPPNVMRRVWNFERLFLRVPYANISLCTRIKGNIPENELRGALEKVRTIHPLVGAKVVFDSERNAWFSTDDVPGPMLRVVPRQSDSQWLDEIQYEQTIPFDPSTGPLIRFVLVYSPEVSDFIVFAHHTISDGESLAILTRDTLKHIADPLLEEKVIFPPILADYALKIPGNVVIKFIRRLIVDRYNKQWSKKRWFFDQEDFLNIHTAFWQKHTYKIVLLMLEKDETEHLIETCREHGVTIGSAVTTAFIAAYRDVCGAFKGHQKIVHLPYDLRQRLDTPVGDVFCNFFTAFEFKFTYHSQKSFWQNAQTLHRKVRKKLDTRDIVGYAQEIERFDPTLMDVLPSFALNAKDVPEGFSRYDKLSAFVRDKNNVAFKFSKRVLSAYPGTTNTNLGRLNFPETYGNLRLERMFWAPSAGPNPLMLGGVGVSGTTTFTLNYIEDTSGNEALRTATLIKVRNRAFEYLGFPEKISNSAIL